MKEIEYTKHRTVGVLDKGIYNGFKYAILSLGTHPCYYVFIPKGHKYYGKDFDDIDINCHGGLTYSDDDLYCNPVYLTDTWIIGWDYAHSCDYVGIYDDNSYLAKNTKKWTTKEMQQEVFEVINQLCESEV